MDGLQPVEPVEVAKVGVEGVGVEKVRELVEEAEVVSGWEPVGEVGGVVWVEAEGLAFHIFDNS